MNNSNKIHQYIILLKKSSKHFCYAIESIRKTKNNATKNKLIDNLMEEYFIPLTKINRIEVLSYILTDTIHSNNEFHYIASGLKTTMPIEGPMIVIKIKSDISATKWRELWLSYKNIKKTHKQISSKEFLPKNNEKSVKENKKWDNIDLYLEILRLTKNKKWSIQKIDDNLTKIKQRIEHPLQPSHSKEELKRMLNKIQNLISTLA